MSPQPARRRGPGSRHRHLERERAARRLAVLVTVAVVAVVVVLLTAFGGAAAPAAADRRRERIAPRSRPGRRRSQVVAKVGLLHLQLPVSQSRVTAIGYQGGSEGALALDPVGTQANQGLLQRLARKVIGGARAARRAGTSCRAASAPSTSALDVGAPAGTDVYSPVDGSVIAITPVVLNGRDSARGSTSSRPARRRSSSRSRTSAPTRRSRSARR